jgi:hypothetical protein
VKSAVSAVLVAALLVGCGSGGDDDDPAETRAETAAETPPPSADTARFETASVGFTFEYPKDFAVETKPRGDVLGQVSLDPRGGLNALKVRETADRRLRPKDYLEEFRRDFARTVGKVDKRVETIGGLETGVLVFEDSVEQDGETVELTSSSYFFSGAGRTWQLECIADDDHREEIAEACGAALESVEFKRK